MKTFIIGLFGLALLASDAAAAPQNPNYPQGPFPQVGTPAVCNYTGGIIIIVITKSGDVTALACSEVNGKPITNESALKPGLPSTPAVKGGLGEIEKFKSPSDPDPCIVWTISGRSYFYCW